MDQRLRKLAADMPTVLRASAQSIRGLTNKLASLETTHDAQSLELKAYKLARRMEQRGLNPETGFEEKVAHIKTFGHEKMAAFEQAIEMAPVTNSSGFRLGTTDPEEKTATAQAGGSSGNDVLSDYIMSQAAFNA